MEFVVNFHRRPPRKSLIYRACFNILLVLFQISDDTVATQQLSNTDWQELLFSTIDQKLLWLNSNKLWIEKVCDLCYGISAPPKHMLNKLWGRDRKRNVSWIGLLMVTVEETFISLGTQHATMHFIKMVCLSDLLIGWTYYARKT